MAVRRRPRAISLPRFFEAGGGGEGGGAAGVSATVGGNSDMRKVSDDVAKCVKRQMVWYAEGVQHRGTETQRHRGYGRSAEALFFALGVWWAGGGQVVRGRRCWAYLAEGDGCVAMWRVGSRSGLERPLSCAQMVGCACGSRFQERGARSTQRRFSQDSRPASASCTPLAPSRRVHGKGASTARCFRKSSH